MVCLEDHEFFGAIGAYYADFSQIADDEVIELLKQFPVGKEHPCKTARGVKPVTQAGCALPRRV